MLNNKYINQLVRNSFIDFLFEVMIKCYCAKVSSQVLFLSLFFFLYKNEKMGANILGDK